MAKIKLIITLILISAYFNIKPMEETQEDWVIVKSENLSKVLLGVDDVLKDLQKERELECSCKNQALKIFKSNIKLEVQCLMSSEEYLSNISEIKKQKLEYILKYLYRKSKLVVIEAIKEDERVIEYLFSSNKSEMRKEIYEIARAVFSKLVKYLDININIQDENDRTVLINYILSSDKDNKEMISLLIPNLNNNTEMVFNNIDLNIRDNRGKTALIYAIIHSDKDLVELLIKNGADVNISDNMRKAPLVYAISQENKEILNLLIKNGANLDSKDNLDQTPLMAAAKRKSNIIKILLKHYIYKDSQDTLGQTALIIAAKNGNLEPVKLLVKYGADTSEKDIGNKTALDYAKERKHLEIVNFLKITKKALLQKTSASQKY